MAQLIKRPPESIGNLSWLQTRWGSGVERLFWIRNVPAGQGRGGHRHPSGHMALCCLVGSVSIYVQTSLEDQQYLLQTATDYLLLPPQDWRLMYNFSPDAVLLVLAQQPYALMDYIDEAYRPVKRPISNWLQLYTVSHKAGGQIAYRANYPLGHSSRLPPKE